MGRIDEKEIFKEKWRSLQQKCFKRDGYRCQFCIGKKRRKCNSKSNIQMHHILCRKTHPYLTWNLDNVITLCGYHHYHFVTGKEHIYAEQFKKTVKRNG